jgi:hypothetical protein
VNFGPGSASISCVNSMGGRIFQSTARFQKNAVGIHKTSYSNL